MTDDRLTAYMTRNVPRYTSYPTAPHFQTANGTHGYKRALAALDPDAPVSLYLHVPFCRQLCWYCGCNMKLASRDGPIARYAQSLGTEIRLLAEHLPARMKVSHLHWGGGTPTALSPEDLTGLMGALRARFDILPDAELAIESDPRSLTDDMIQTNGQLGFTRASFGVQEFDPKVQAAINRVQPPDMVARAVDGLRAAGVTGINFDLIYGLPHQTIETLLETIRLCAAIDPNRVALFGYAHVPWMAKKQRLIDEAALPGVEDRRAQSNAAADALAAAGYQPIGLDHFARADDPLAIAARSGRLRRNFQGYTTDQAKTMLALGATSVGRLPDRYIQNVAEPGAWARAVEAGDLPLGKELPLEPEDLLRGTVIEALMCQGKVNPNAMCEDFGLPPNHLDTARPMLEAFQSDGLITLENGVITATSTGLPLIRVIASAFDAYAMYTPKRHAVAVWCLIPRFDGVILSLEWKEALWDKFVMAAPRPRTPSELTYSDRKLRSRS